MLTKYMAIPTDTSKQNKIKNSMASNIICPII